jgi:hypothetical protein
MIMKRIFFTIVTSAVIWGGAQMPQMNSASAQTDAFTGNVVPLTNLMAFTNTVVPTTNLSALQFEDVMSLLLSLQTNVEESLPALTVVTTNALPAVNPAPAPVQTLGFVPPITSGPPDFFLTPTGAATGQALPPSFVVKVGTNTLTIDQATFQGLVTLRDQLQQTLPLLQALNGTAPSPTNAGTVTTILIQPLPAITNLPVTPITNGFATPLTNQMQFLAPNVPSAF